MKLSWHRCASCATSCASARAVQPPYGERRAAVGENSARCGEFPSSAARSDSGSRAGAGLPSLFTAVFGVVVAWRSWSTNMCGLRCLFGSLFGIHSNQNTCRAALGPCTCATCPAIHHTSTRTSTLTTERSVSHSDSLIQLFFCPSSVPARSPRKRRVSAGVVAMMNGSRTNSSSSFISAAIRALTMRGENMLKSMCT